MKKPLPIGYDNFEQVISEGFYYVDKTLLIKALLDDSGNVSLFTRPRRFGKTLALSMLRYYFEKAYDYDGNPMDYSGLFSGMKIMEAGEKYVREMGKYPVINLSLKSAKQPTYEMAYAMLTRRIAEEYKRHAYVVNSIKEEKDRQRFILIMNESAEEKDYADALAFLSQILSRVYGEKTIILLDEYDVPLENAYFRGFYQEMVDFIRSLFESALKTNEFLKFAVVTGCLRISKESIFTGLNNLEVVSILNVDYAEYFGFTENEVKEMLAIYGKEQKLEELKEWYDGYLFGNTEVYNPWSVINYVKAVYADVTAFPKPYWSNTSSNQIVRELIETADESVKKEIEQLIAGGTIEKPVHEDITYEDIYRTQDNLWNFLFFTGYLKAVKQRFEIDTIYLTLKIPNAEIRYIYRSTIREWFHEKIKQTDFTSFYQAILAGKYEEMEQFITKQLSASISYHDSAENFYHGYLLGILSRFEGYQVESNREHGDGRPDIVLCPYSPQKPVIIMELKKAEKFAQMEGLCEAALTQIEEKNYGAEYLEEGYHEVVNYGICFCRKSCMVKKQ